MSRIVILGLTGAITSCMEKLLFGRDVGISTEFRFPEEAFFSAEAKTEKQSEAWQEKPNRNAGFARAKRAAKKRGRAR